MCIRCVSLFVVRVLGENVRVCKVHCVCVVCVCPASHPKKSGHPTAALHFMLIIIRYMWRKVLH